MGISLRASVGSGGQNQRDDVENVQQRLKDLGYSFVGSVDGLIGPNTIHAIKLFQSITSGHQAVQGDGRIDVNGDTLKWLNASNAPEWQKMTSRGPGFDNIEVTVESSGNHEHGMSWLDSTFESAAASWANHDHGTSWLDSAIKAASIEYKNNYYDVAGNSSLVIVNYTSLANGGDSRYHRGHQTGLSSDLGLPQKNNTGTPPGYRKRTFKSADYDRNAARAMLVALRNQPLANHNRIFFNDRELIKENLCLKLAGHDNHIHFEVRPPARQ